MLLLASAVALYVGRPRGVTFAGRSGSEGSAHAAASAASAADPTAAVRRGRVRRVRRGPDVALLARGGEAGARSVHVLRQRRLPDRLGAPDAVRASAPRARRVGDRGSVRRAVTSPWRTPCAGSSTGIAPGRRSARTTTAISARRIRVESRAGAPPTGRASSTSSTASSSVRARRLPSGGARSSAAAHRASRSNPNVLYPVLARNGFLYDASSQARLGTWPRRELGLWSFPLLEIPFIGHTFRVVTDGLQPLREPGEREPGPGGARGLPEPLERVPRELRRPPRAAHDRPALRDVGLVGTIARSRRSSSAHARFRRCAARATAASRPFLDSVPRWRLRRYEAGRFPPLRGR